MALVPSSDSSLCVLCDTNGTNCLNCSANNFCANCVTNFGSVNGLCFL